MPFRREDTFCLFMLLRVVLKILMDTLGSSVSGPVQNNEFSTLGSLIVERGGCLIGLARVLVYFPLKSCTEMTGLLPQPQSYTPMLLFPFNHGSEMLILSEITRPE